MDRASVKRDYEIACNNYLRLFCDKHEFDFEDARNSWVGGCFGEVVQCGDYFIDFHTIMVDIDNDVPKDVFLQYYDYCLSAGEFDLEMPNYRAWILGCPRTSEETFEKLNALKNQLRELIEDEKCRYSY